MRAAMVALLCLACCTAPGQQRVRDRWDFRFKDFVIGAWWGPAATDAEMRLYKDAGFNVVMTGRYMQMDDYGRPERALSELDLARKHGLRVMFDTYTKNDRPWGGVSAGSDGHAVHHPASRAELEWLYREFGSHPALAGFMVGDDLGEVSARSHACTQFLFEKGPPHLVPWLCGWISPENLARHNNPVANPQIYPTLYNWSAPAAELARHYAGAYAAASRACRERGVIFWPMFNATIETQDKPQADMFGAMPSDSLLRFPAYAALAYGAEGIWYFTYNGGALQHVGPHTTRGAARKALTPLYPVARRINRRIAAWGPRLMGRTAAGLFGTAFGAAGAAWPLPLEEGAPAPAEDLHAPAPGKLVEAMDPDLLAGVLTAPGKRPLLMVVDCRASKSFGDLKERTVAIRFSPRVRGVRILEGRSAATHWLAPAQPGRVAWDVQLQNGERKRRAGPPGWGDEDRFARAPASLEASRRVHLHLEAGGGQLLELVGDGLEPLCTPASIAASAAQAWSAARRLTQADLARVKAARLRIDTAGSNGEPEYAAKYVELNGRRLAAVPPGGSGWGVAAIPLAPEQLGWLRASNEVTVRTECADAWKFRNLCLAVQLEDGTWVATNRHAEVHSSPGWAHTEGRAWGADGVAGPIRLEF